MPLAFKALLDKCCELIRRVGYVANIMFILLCKCIVQSLKHPCIANFTGGREEVDEKINLNILKHIAFGPES